ncbi:PKD domain-containing protein, partial [Sediminibacterium goheungense]
YSVVATSAEGCSSASVSSSVTVNPVPTAAISANGPTTFCAGGSVTLTATGGASYLWSNGATTSSITVSNGGTYSVVATSAEGCSSASVSTSVTVNPVPTAAISADGPTTFCAGGSVTLTATGGASYLWSNGATTSSITVSSGGVYSVVATSAEGCSSASVSTTVTVNPKPTVSISANGPTTFCAGGSVTLTASGGVSYLWSNGANTASITVSTAGTYSVVAVNGAGCSSRAEVVTVNVNPLPVATITANGSTSFCAGGSVTLTAGGGTSYLWSNGANTASVNVTTGGTYSVVAINAAGCQSAPVSQTVTVTAQPTVNITANGPLNFCPGGSVTLDAGPAASYLWSNGATSRTITVNTSGNYAVTINNGNNCTATSAAVTVNATDNIAPSITAPANITVTYGQTVVLGNAVASDNCSVTVTNNAPSVFPVGVTIVTWTATDGSGNTKTAQQTVTVLAPATCSSSITVVPENTIYTGGVPTDIYLGYGPQKVTLKVNATGGSSYTYSWTSVSGGGTLSNNASSQPVFAPSVAGIYVFRVQVRTQSGCVTTSTVTICVKDIRVKESDDNKCDHKSHSYKDCKHSQHNHSKCDHKSHDKSKCKDKYDDGDDDDDECDHRSHDYKNCKHKGHRHSSCDHRSHSSSSCKNKYDDDDDDDHDDDDDDDNYKVYICHVPPGNSGNPLTLSISINAVESHLRNHSGDRLGSCGTQNSCSVSQPPVCTSSITADGSTTFCTGGSVKLTASAGSSYKWNTGATTQSITVTASGTYSVIVTYANGCKAPSVSQTVTVNPKPVVNISANGPLNFCPGGSVTLDAGVANAYQWSNGATTRTITVNKSGNYNVTINNGNGCTATSSTVCVTVSDNVPPTITAPANITVTSGQPVVLGTPVANDNCSVTVTNNAPSVYPVGTTTVTWTARDGSGNTATATQRVTVVAPVVCSSNITVIPENNVYTGGIPTNIYIGYGPQKVTLRANATGGSGYSYNWRSVSGGGSLSSTSSSQPVFCPSKEGYYTFEVRITNSAGCVSTSQVSICVKDIRVDDDCDDWGWRSSSYSKVYISRRYGNTNNYTVLQVKVSDVANHLNCYPNDRLGKGLTGCVTNALSSPVTTGVNTATLTTETPAVSSGGKIVANAATETDLDVQVMGNPSYNYFIVRVRSKETAPVQVKVVDMYGRTVEAKANQQANSTLQIGEQYQTGTYFAEFRQGTRRKVVQLIKLKR